VLADTLADPKYEAAIREVSQALAHSDSNGMPSRAQSMRELEGRLLAARMSCPPESAETAFGFLEGVRADQFVAAAEALSPGTREAGLRFAPPRLRTAYVAGLEAAARSNLLLSWARQSDLTPAYVAAAAEEWRGALAQSGVGVSAGQRALATVLDALPRSEQDAIVERLRREGHARLAETAVVESDLLTVPAEVLAAAVTRVPQQQLLGYLGRAEGDVRGRLLSQLPPRMAEDLRTELASGELSNREESLAGRQVLIARLRDELGERGLKPRPAVPLRNVAS